MAHARLARALLSPLLVMRTLINTRCQQPDPAEWQKAGVQNGNISTRKKIKLQREKSKQKEEFGASPHSAGLHSQHQCRSLMGQ